MQHPTQSTLVTTQQPLIPTLIGDLAGQQQPLVDARTLHEFLQVGTPFNKWVSRRISEFDFVETLDFTVADKNVLVDRGFFGQRDEQIKNYHLSLDMAKELCMLERSDMGRVARRYFIECERNLRGAAHGTLALKSCVLEAKPEWAQLLRYKQMGLSYNECSKLLGIGNKTAWRWGIKLKEAGFEVPDADRNSLSPQAQLQLLV